MRRIAVTCLLLALPSLLNAQEPAVRLSTCISDNTSGRDRKDLARWVFFAMASIPEFNPYLAPTATEALEEANRSTGVLLTRLLTDSCAAQTKEAVKQGGPQALDAGFATLGQLAIRELMTNDYVSATAPGLLKYIDQQKLSETLNAR